jgi:hypothetical protein
MSPTPKNTHHKKGLAPVLKKQKTKKTGGGGRAVQTLDIRSPGALQRTLSKK